MRLKKYLFTKIAVTDISVHHISIEVALFNLKNKL